MELPKAFDRVTALESDLEKELLMAFSSESIAALSAAVAVVKILLLMDASPALTLAGQ